MGKASRWFRSFLTGKKNDKKHDNFSAPFSGEIQSGPISIPTKDKKRWSFRSSVGMGKSMHSPESSVSASVHGLSEVEIDQKRHAMAVAVATAAAANAAVAAAQAAASVMRMTVAVNKSSSGVQKNAAVKIQTVFRGYLARKALCALRGIVKLQAFVRGDLVRKKTAATLCCMQALASAQARICAQRIHMIAETQAAIQRQSTQRRSQQHPRYRQSFETDKSLEDDVKIVEMDFGGLRGSTKNRSSYSVAQTELKDPSFSEYYGNYRVTAKADYPQFSPAQAALTETSPRTYSGRFEDFSFTTAHSSSPYLSAISVPGPSHPSLDHSFFPSYMANTESSIAKARSQSAPRQRTDMSERQTSRRRPSLESKNIPSGVKTQRSSFQLGMKTNGNPWSVKLNKSSASLKPNECVRRAQ